MIDSLAVDVLIKATVLLALVALVAHLLRRKSAALRHMLWTLAIVGIVALPVLTALVPFRLRILPATTPSPSVQRERDPSPSTPATVSEPVVSLASDPAPPPSEPPRGLLGPLDLTSMLAALWLVGTLILLARLIIGLVIVRGIARRAVSTTDASWRSLADRCARSLGVGSVDLRRSDDVAMPFACGLIKAAIVLPSSSDEWSAARREAVLMHEFAHISRGDLAMNTLSHFVRAFYWPHPLAWLATYRLRVEGERACDDAVLRAGALPSDYAEHLLSIVRTVGNTVPSVALAMARRSDFEGRLLAILESGIPRGGLTRWRAIGVAAAFVFVVMPLAAMAPAPASPAAVATPTSSAATLSAPAAPVASTAGASNTIRTVQVTPPTSTPAQAAEQSTGTVAALIETLSDANAAVRVAAANSLGSLGDPRAIAALAKALREDADARVREAAAHALGEIDDSRAVAPLLEALKSERVAKVREKIVHALGEIDDPAAVAGISTVVKDPSVNVRREAVWALGELEDQAAVPALLTMVRDDDAEVRKHTAEALGQLKSIASLDALTTLTRDEDADVRVQAINALGQLEDMRTLAPLVAALRDPNPDVRSQAADAIHNIDDLKRAPPALIELLADPNREVRKNVAHALGNIGDPAAVPALKRAASDSDTEVRRAAAEALSDIGGPEAITALMGMLKDQDPEIRRIAAEALGSRRR